MQRHHPTKFGDLRYCGSEDIKFLVCHVTSQDHLVKRSSDSIDRIPSR